MSSFFDKNPYKRKTKQSQLNNNSNNVKSNFNVSRHNAGKENVHDRTENGTDKSNDETSLQRALHYAIGTLCRAQEQDEDTDEQKWYSDDNNNANHDKQKSSTQDSSTSTGNSKPKMSKEAIKILTEMTYHYATKCLASDLQSFSNHANRRTITVDDVKLVARKNPRGLLDSLERFCENGGDGIGVSDSKQSKTRKERNVRNMRSFTRNDDDGGRSFKKVLGLPQKKKYSMIQAESLSESECSREEMDYVADSTAKAATYAAATDVAGEDNNDGDESELGSSSSEDDDRYKFLLRSKSNHSKRIKITTDCSQDDGEESDQSSKNDSNHLFQKQGISSRMAIDLADDDS